MSVDAAYGARSAEYTALFGDISATHPDDRALVAGWAARVPGRIIDLGCGPGQWTGYLHGLGAEVTGIDLTPEFVEIARVRHPGLEFEVGDARRLGRPDGCVGGVLAWYSLIHLAPEEIPAAVEGLHRVLRPDGALLVGFFDGEDVEEFAHAVAPAWFWPPDRLAEELERHGFAVDDVTRRREPGARSHAAISAHRTG